MEIFLHKKSDVKKEETKVKKNDPQEKPSSDFSIRSLAKIDDPGQEKMERLVRSPAEDQAENRTGRLKFGLKSMQMFRLDYFGNKIETSYAFKPFTPLVYSETSNYVMEILIYTTVKRGDQSVRRVSQKAINLREVVNIDNSENKK